MIHERQEALGGAKVGKFFREFFNFEDVLRVNRPSEIDWSRSRIDRINSFWDMMNWRLIFVWYIWSWFIGGDKNQLSIDYISKIIDPIDSGLWPIDLWGSIYHKGTSKIKNSWKNVFDWRPLAPPVVPGSLWPNGQSFCTRWDLPNDIYVVRCICQGGASMDRRHHPFKKSVSKIEAK